MCKAAYDCSSIRALFTGRTIDNDRIVCSTKRHRRAILGIRVLVLRECYSRNIQYETK